MSNKFHPEFTEAFRDAARKTKCWNAAKKKNWNVKFSIYDEATILVTIQCRITGQTYLRFFNDEDVAVQFITFVTRLD